MIKIIFDKTCLEWFRDTDLNMTYLTSQRDLIKFLLRQRGYIYLNQIYEIFTAPWNPDNENLCWRKEKDLNIEIGEPDQEGAIVITIT